MRYHQDMGRILAVDWGERRVGVAISDELQTLARPLPTLIVDSWRETARALEALVAEYGVETVVVGNPMHMNGEEGASTRKVRRLVDALQERLPGVRFVFWDERLSSRQAEEILRARKERVRGNRGRLDQIAAAVLLQSYLDGVGP